MNLLFTTKNTIAKILISIIVLVISFAAAYSQSAWRDGIFYLKVKDASVALPLWQSGRPLTQLDAFPELKNLVTTYNVTSIRPASKIPAVLSAPNLYDRLSAESRKQLTELSTFYRIDFAVGGNFEAFRNALQALRYVQSVDGEPIRKTGLTGTPNDLGSNTTPAAGPGTIPPLNGQWYLYTINAGGAWTSFTGSATPVVVAVIDDGFRISHQDYNPVRWINPVDVANGIDDDGNGKIDDINGWDVADNDAGLLWGTGTRNHGMHCAGLAAAATDNGLGVASIAHNQARIWGVKAAQNSTPAPNLDATTEGIEYVVETFVRHKFVHSQNYRLVVSMSFGGPAGFSFYEQTLFNFGASIDIVFFAAAGNDNVDMTTNPYYPCSYNNVICVGSTDNAPVDVRSSFSNYGPQIDVMAPGENMLSLDATADNLYYRSQGTSMATPVAAGLGCLLLKNNPALTRDQVEGLLRSTAVNIYALPGNAAYAGKLGAGRINAAAAVSASLPNRLDASPVAVVSPAVTTCMTTVIPQVRIGNPGSVTITSLTLNVQYDAAPATNIPFGPISIPAGGNLVLTLPAQALAVGAHTLRIITQNPNAGTDMALINDTLRYSFTIFNTAAPITLPFTETFESGSFATNGWVVDNPDAANQGWQIRSNAGMGNGGLRAATVNIVNYDYYRGVTPQLVKPPRDGLISRPIDLTSVATHGDVTLKFQHSYRAGNLATPDTLNVYVSTDCGATFPFRIWSSGQSVDFTTTSPGVFTDYLPTNANHWSRWNPDFFALPVSVKLNQFIGQTILLKFEVITVGGTNIYVDSIDIRSTPPLTTCQDSVLRLNFPPANSHAIYGFVGGGFFSGHNVNGDRAYAEKFNYGTGYKKLLSAIYNFGFANAASTANVTLKIWKDDGLNGGPGTVLASTTG
jgi:subtilisin family serine protease